MCACNGANRPGCSCDTSHYTRVTSAGMANRLVPSLTCTADAIRDLFTVLGARAYEVHLVHTRWTGGQRGLGSQYVVSDVMILPTPLVASLDAISTQLLSVGSAELGNLTVTQISPRFDEYTLRGWIEGSPPGEDTQFFYDIVFPQTGGLEPIRRRFTVTGVPSYQPLQFQWSVTLTKAFAERQADGEMSE